MGAHKEEFTAWQEAFASREDLLLPHREQLLRFVSFLSGVHAWEEREKEMDRFFRDFDMNGRRLH